ncbi:acyl carrier protein, partial [Streptomyces pseudogriseolus]
YAAAAEAAGAGGVADAWVLRSAGTAEQPSAAGAGEELRRLENELAAVWCTVLGRDRVYRDENFFDLGGNSLLLVAAQTALNKALGCELTVVDLFAHPTVRALARHLADQGTAVPAASAAPAPDPSATQAGTTGAAGTAGTTGTAESEGLGRAKEQAQRQRAARAARRSARERKDRGRG